MKIIDGKGRVFGRINIIDLLAVIFALSLIPAFFSFKQRVVKKSAADSVRILKAEAKKAEAEAGPAEILKYVQIEAVCDFIQIPPSVFGLIEKGDVGVNDKGEETAEVIWVGGSRPFVRYYNLGSDENGRPRRAAIADPEMKNLTVKLRLNAQAKGSDLYYNGEPLRMQASFTFVTGKYSVKANIVDVEKIYE